jgi:hypothetical protein
MARIGAQGGRARGLAHQRALQAAAEQQTQNSVPQVPPIDTLN